MLIDQSELEQLLKIKRIHEEECSRKAILKSGSGECSSCNKPSSANNEEICHASSENIEPKQVISETVEAQSADNKRDSIDTTDIINHIRKRYRAKARLFLDALKKENEIEWNCHGIVSLHGVQIKGSSIFDLMSVSFYPLKFKQVIGLREFVNFVNEKGLGNNILNQELLPSGSKSADESEPWFFLGLIN